MKQQSFVVQTHHQDIITTLSSRRLWSFGITPGSELGNRLEIASILQPKALTETPGGLINKVENFKAYNSQLPVIEQALETAGLMLGTDKSRGYCLEMICADFLAGVSLETGNEDALLSALTRLVLGLPKPQRDQLIECVQVAP